MSYTKAFKNVYFVVDSNLDSKLCKILTCMPLILSKHFHCFNALHRW